MTWTELIFIDPLARGQPFPRPIPQLTASCFGRASGSRTVCALFFSIVATIKTFSVPTNEAGQEQNKWRNSLGSALNRLYHIYSCRYFPSIALVVAIFSIQCSVYGFWLYYLIHCTLLTMQRSIPYLVVKSTMKSSHDFQEIRLIIWSDVPMADEEVDDHCKIK